MFYWIYDMPTWALGALISFVFLGITWLGIVGCRPLVHKYLRSESRANDLVGFTLSSFAVFYGLLLGLIAVAVFQAYSNIDDNVNHEAASLTSLYHMVSQYPQPIRGEMQEKLRQYTLDTIEVGWPQQQHGIVPSGGPQRMSILYEKLLPFQPQDKRQEIVHAETLRELNHYVELRRSRLASVTAGIPGVVWYVVAIGALLNVVLICLFDMNLRVHLILGSSLSLFLGMLIFLIAAMDNPFRGEVSISPEALQSVYNSLMKPPQLTTLQQ